MKKPPLLYVEFGDHASGSEWANEDETIEHPLPCMAVGWKLKETKDLLVLGAFVSDDYTKSVSRSNVVKSTITKRRRIKLIP